MTPDDDDIRSPGVKAVKLPKINSNAFHTQHSVGTATGSEMCDKEDGNLNKTGKIAIN